MHRSGVKAMGRNRTEPNARCSHADIGRGLGRVRYVAERYRLLAQDRVRSILEGTIISDEDWLGGSRADCNPNADASVWDQPGLRHWLLRCALRTNSGLIRQHGGAGLEYGSFYPHELTPCDLLPGPNNVTVLRSRENVRESNRRDAVFAPRRRA